MKPEQEADLILQIWRTLMDARPSFYPGGLGGVAQTIPVPDPVATAAKARDTFKAMFPAPAKPARAKRK